MCHLNKSGHIRGTDADCNYSGMYSTYCCVRSTLLWRSVFVYISRVFILYVFSLRLHSRVSHIIVHHLAYSSLRRNWSPPVWTLETASFSRRYTSRRSFCRHFLLENKLVNITCAREHGSRLHNVECLDGDLSKEENPWTVYPYAMVLSWMNSKMAVCLCHETFNNK